MHFLERLLPKFQDHYEYVLAVLIIAIWWIYKTVRNTMRAHRARENRQHWTQDKAFDPADPDASKTPRRRIPLA